MSKPVDSPAVARRRAREARTVSQMISIYCRGHHGLADRTEQGHCGEDLCACCKGLDDYAVLRTQRCRRMERKISCEACQNHCYAHDAQKKIREVMRYAGPRMILRHPIAAFRHLAGRFAQKRREGALSQGATEC